MSGGPDRLNIFPSRANHVWMKQRILGAVKGLSLLKRKRDALELKLRQVNAELSEHKDAIREVMAEAIFTLAKARFLNTDFKPTSVTPVDRADVYMRIRNTKIAGLLLPQFDLIMRPPSSFPLTGLSHGGRQVEIVRHKFQEAILELICVASLEYSARILEDGVRQTNMRVNGLDYVVIPRYQNTLNYIRDELDEFEREDFYRLKRSQAKQRVAKDAFATLIKEKDLPKVENKDKPEDQPVEEDRKRSVGERNASIASTPGKTMLQNPLENDTEEQPVDDQPGTTGLNLEDEDLGGERASDT